MDHCRPIRGGSSPCVRKSGLQPEISNAFAQASSEQLFQEDRSDEQPGAGVPDDEQEQGHGFPNIWYNLRDDLMAPGGKDIYTRLELRLYLYHRVYLSCSPSMGAECIVLLLHKHNGETSFARVGDSQWTRISWKEPNERFPCNEGCRAAAYSKNDGLFYVLFSDDSVFTLDLNGPSPVARRIIQGAARLETSAKSIVLTPWGDIFQITIGSKYASTCMVAVRWVSGIL
ncbi:hypothetical protein PR202_gb13027 [Eleusine coracana subsp. coracana]|uniref:KIB1-4 beta-propeller domain-containing protein n=1 Tax=Eleusine coracana subsp. coracana TaxID=191504 RepID=A0AAV5ERZ8_ELECO|nr:hypothetical protein PR202_gb13027 [Eleusine coracana subsp. coracana]